MACKKALKHQMDILEEIKSNERLADESLRSPMRRLLFGVDSSVPSNVILQNNITEFEWVKLNKMHPNFWGRNIVGDNCLDTDEIGFLHKRGCKIAAIYTSENAKETNQQGIDCADEILGAVADLNIPKNTAVFIQIADNENVTRDFMFALAQKLIDKEYVPAFKANTDARFVFDREYSIGMRSDKEIFSKCLVWATAPTLDEYDSITTGHLIHPDNWKPFAPSGITRKDIAVWQYGKNCHPIYDDGDNYTYFNIDLVTDHRIIIEKMF